MQQTNSVSSVLPVSPAAPVPGNSANSTAASSASDGQPAFSQVLRDKQMANADAAKAANASSTSKTDSKPAAGAKDAGEVSTDKRAADETASDTGARTPTELAQLLAAAGLMANAGAAQNAATTGSADTAALATDELLTDASAKLATDANALTTLPQTDKTAATSTNLAASLAANTANTTTSPEQALASQSALPDTDSKSGQAGAQSGNQGSDRQALVAAANADGEKLRANTTTSETSFASALEQAGQNNGTAPAAVNVTTQTQAPAATTHTVTTPVGRQGWADEVGQRVLWTAKSDSSRADIVLTPPQLGRIEVSIQMNGDQANASFMVANPVAREALQDAMPRLRELLSQAGIQLGQADVSAGQSGQNSGREARRQAGGSGGTGMLGSDVALGSSSGWTRGGSGMVDTFA